LLVLAVFLGFAEAMMRDGDERIGAEDLKEQTPFVPLHLEAEFAAAALTQFT